MEGLSLRLTYTEAGETADDKRRKLTLHLGLTTFFTFLATNRRLDHSVIPAVGIVARFKQNRTIRDVFVTFAYALENSVLASTISTNVVVISSDLDQRPNNQVLIRMRSRKVALYRSCHQVAASGFVSLAHTDESGRPNPLVTAIEEARQEIADSLVLQPADNPLYPNCNDILHYRKAA